MSDKQLAILLFHILRQINEATSEVEAALRQQGLTLEDAQSKVMNLRALAEVLHTQYRDLTYV